MRQLMENKIASSYDVEEHQIGQFLEDLLLEDGVDRGPTGQNDSDGWNVELVQFRMATQPGDLWRKTTDHFRLKKRSK